MPKRPFEVMELTPGRTVQLLGYRGFAELASTIREEFGEPPLTAKAVRNYAYKDRLGGEPHLLPQPIAVGENELPYWLPSQVHNWIRNRPGSGNRTTGEARRRTQVPVA